ncbi:4-(cytidine 5'-diphospho)-2-C-methyl-D-erythritol kinase [Pseudosulfitobacter sp. SM2401]|uniref:4-(cytidine 5'-diphospho)-2-C-methyl-D-erythritol kinase n=1 Tax=Pseudosulfitobacter sp. SM2401 TaxID=3350098 RepID=UPI0036F3FEDD
MTIEAFAPAKINLTLHVTGQRHDGYHLLDSLVVFANVGDRIWIEPADEMSLEITGPFAQGVPADARNLVWKAAVLAGHTAHIRLEKNLPHGAGIGGGSSDAGALLAALGCADTGVSLGADVPVCRLGQAAQMSGIGDMVEPFLGMPSLFAVLVNSGVHVPTPQVFKTLKNKDNPAMTGEFSTHDTAAALIDWVSDQRNDLEAAAIACAPEIAGVLEVLRGQPNQKLVRMSGSGATCFALFETAADAQTAAAAIRLQNPDWWVVDCALS